MPMVKRVETPWDDSGMSFTLQNIRDNVVKNTMAARASLAQSLNKQFAAPAYQPTYDLNSNVLQPDQPASGSDIFSDKKPYLNDGALEPDQPAKGNDIFEDPNDEPIYDTPDAPKKPIKGGPPIQSKPLPPDVTLPEKNRSIVSNYDTKLTPDEEIKFQEWRKQYVNPNDSGADYDFRGAFKAGLTPGSDGHWRDTYKKPNHPTFSDESIYAVGENKSRAGHWNGDIFIPSDTFHPTRSQPYPISTRTNPTVESSKSYNFGLASKDKEADQVFKIMSGFKSSGNVDLGAKALVTSLEMGSRNVYNKTAARPMVPSRGGVPMDKSAATIAGGIDLGQIGMDRYNKVIAPNLDKVKADALRPLVGKRGYEAMSYIKKNGLDNIVIPYEKAIKINHDFLDDYHKDIVRAYPEFDSASEAIKGPAMSVIMQYGPGAGGFKGPLGRAIKNNDAVLMQKILNGLASKHPDYRNRRRMEIDYLLGNQ